LDQAQQAILAWHDVYAAAAGATATLLGLTFIAGSIHQASSVVRQPPPRHTAWLHLLLNRYEFTTEFLALGTQTYMMFIYAFVFELVMLMPVDLPFAPGLVLVAVAGLGTVEAWLPIIGIRRRKERPPIFEQLWRYWLPAASMFLVIAGGIALAADKPVSLYAIAGGSALLVFGATRNSWDIFLSMGREPDAS
jgi:hypothetical protein